MGHSFTSFKERHIRSKDYKIETFLFLIVKEIDEMKSKPYWLVEARDAWEEEAKISLNGCMDPKLDKYLDNQSKVEKFVDLLSKVTNRLEQFGGKIPKEFLNELCGYVKPYQIMEDNESEPYILYLRCLHSLVTGKQIEKCVSA